MFPLPVVNERGKGSEAVPTVRAQKTLLSRMDHHVDLALLEPGKGFGTELALERFLIFSKEMRQKH